MTAATAPGAARGRAREGASRRKELEDDHELADCRLAFAAGIGGEYAANKLLSAEQVAGCFDGLQLVLLVG